jgi:hypothetical protein
LHVVYFVVPGDAPLGDAVPFVVEIGGESSSGEVTIAISGN